MNIAVAKATKKTTKEATIKKAELTWRMMEAKIEESTWKEMRVATWENMWPMIEKIETPIEQAMREAISK